MEVRFGLVGYSHDGIFFSEHPAATGTICGTVKASSGRQNLNIDKLKSKLAALAKVRGANAVVEFKYYQRANAFSFSSTEWRAEGLAMHLADLTPPPYHAPS